MLEKIACRPDFPARLSMRPATWVDFLTLLLVFLACGTSLKSCDPEGYGPSGYGAVGTGKFPV